MIRSVVLLTAACFCHFIVLISPAFAQDAQTLTGRWVITVTDTDNSGFSAVADVKYDYDREIATAVLVAEDSCCDGLNYAKVKQQSVLSSVDGKVIVRSQIEDFLELVEGLPNITYSPDNFDLMWVNNNKLVGRLNGGPSVEWSRGAGNVS